MRLLQSINETDGEGSPLCREGGSPKSDEEGALSKKLQCWSCLSTVLDWWIHFLADVAFNLIKERHSVPLVQAMPLDWHKISKPTGQTKEQ